MWQNKEKKRLWSLHITNYTENLKNASVTGMNTNIPPSSNHETLTGVHKAYIWGATGWKLKESIFFFFEHAEQYIDSKIKSPGDQRVPTVSKAGTGTAKVALQCEDPPSPPPHTPPPQKTKKKQAKKLEK